MTEQLERLIAAERKYKRELHELRQLRTKVMAQKAPDKKILDLIDLELATYTGQK